MNEMSRSTPMTGWAPVPTGGNGGRPRFRPRPGLIAALDIGTTKFACLIGRVEGDGALRILGIGHARARGVRGAAVVDLEAAEQALRATVASAEEMADTELREVIVNLSCGAPESRIVSVQQHLGGHPVEASDLRRVLQEARARGQVDGRDVLHTLPLGFQIDDTQGVRDPRGMVGETLAARLHLIDAAEGPVRNLAACLQRCDLGIEAMVAAPYAAGIAALVDDERELGVTVVDMGGGITTIAVFAEGNLIHTDFVPVGGQHVTSDVARGLSTPLASAERMKTLYGSTNASPEDDRELLAVPLVGEEEHQVARVPRSMLVGIIRPRLEETFELVRAKLEDSGLHRASGRRVVLTGGAAQLMGARDLASAVLEKQVRLGRPIGFRGLPEAASGPAFATTAGLLAWAASEGERLRDLHAEAAQRSGGRFRRALSWIRENL